MRLRTHHLTSQHRLLWKACPGSSYLGSSTDSLILAQENASVSNVGGAYNKYNRPLRLITCRISPCQQAFYIQPQLILHVRRSWKWVNPSESKGWRNANISDFLTFIGSSDGSQSPQKSFSVFYFYFSHISLPSVLNMTSGLNLGFLSPFPLWARPYDKGSGFTEN